MGNISWYQNVEGTRSPISTSGLTDVQIFRGTQTGRSLAGVLFKTCERDRRHCTRDERNCVLNETPTYQSRTVWPPGGSKVGSFFVVLGLIGGIAPFPQLWRYLKNSFPSLSIDEDTTTLIRAVSRSDVIWCAKSPFENRTKIATFVRL